MGLEGWEGLAEWGMLLVCFTCFLPLFFGLSGTSEVSFSEPKAWHLFAQGPLSMLFRSIGLQAVAIELGMVDHPEVETM